MSRYLPVTFAGSVGATAIRHGRLPKAMAKLRRRAQFLKRELDACRAQLNLPPEEDQEEDLDDLPMQGAPGWMEHAFGGRVPAGRVSEAWAPESRLSPNVRVRTRKGERVVYRQLADGVFLLIEVPELVVQRATTFGGEDEAGFVDLIVKAATGTVNAIQQGVKAGQKGGKPGDIAKAMGQGFMNSALPGVLPGSRPAPQAAPAPAPAPQAACQCRSAAPQLPGPVAQPSVGGWPTFGCACAQCGRA